MGQSKTGAGKNLGCFYHDSEKQKHTKMYMLVALSPDVFPIRKIQDNAQSMGGGGERA